MVFEQQHSFVGLIIIINIMAPVRCLLCSDELGQAKASQFNF